MDGSQVSCGFLQQPVCAEGTRWERKGTGQVTRDEGEKESGRRAERKRGREEEGTR